MNLHENTATSEEHVLVKQHNSQYNCVFYGKMNCNCFRTTVLQEEK